MKKIIAAILLFFLLPNVSISQEWLTSFAIAKRLALSQNKMILAVWEDSANYSFPMVAEDKRGKKVVVDIFEDEAVKELIWTHFVPVIIREAKYEDLAKDVVGKRSLRYVDRFNDEFLKVMDPNGIIVNVSFQDDYTNSNLTYLIRNYGINLSMIKRELKNYSENKNFSTTFRLGKKYQDISIFANTDLKKKIIQLSSLYMSDAKVHLDASELFNKEALTQKLELLDIEKFLILNRPKKANRLLKKYNKEEIAQINKSLFAYLNYTSLRYLKKVDEALIWKDEVTQVDLNKVKYIIK